MSHLAVLPVLIPLTAGALLLLTGRAGGTICTAKRGIESVAVLTFYHP